MHSDLYHRWMGMCFLGKKFMEEFVQEKMDFAQFTRQDILDLSASPWYGLDFQTKVLAKHVESFLTLLKEEEILPILLKSKSETFKKEMVVYFVKDFEKYENILDLFLDSEKEKHWFYQIIPELYDLSKKNSKYKKFLKPRLYYRFICFVNDFENERIASVIWNDKEIMEYCFQNVCNISKDGIPEFLRNLRKSKYYEELFLKYKMEIYWAFLISGTRNYNQEFQSLILIVEDLLRMENMELSDLKVLPGVGFCNVFLLKKYLLKFGRKHFTYEISNSSSLLYPMLRKQIEKLRFYIEIASLCDTSSITIDDVYYVYKLEREKGNYWLDPKEDNLGVLLEKNNSYPFEVAPETLGFIGENSVFREQGELVILDLDYFFRECDIDWNSPDVIERMKYGMFGELERRYQEELKLTKKS